MKNLNLITESKVIYGSWKASRIILDYHNSCKASFKGEMTLSKMDETKKASAINKPKITRIKFEEEGTLTYNNKTFKTYKFHFIDIRRNQINILFENKKTFFKINKIDASQKISHKCNNDIYNGWIRFLNKRSFFICWNVFGPRKNYYLKAIYKKN